MICTSLFSSRERIRVLELFLSEQEKELGVREIARLVRVSPALVSSTIAILRKAKLVKKNRVELLNPTAKAIKILLNIEKIASCGLIETVKSSFSDCKGIGVFGSWANGTNARESDLDLWVMTEKATDEKNKRIRSLAKAKLGVEANVVFLTQKRLKELKQKDFVFYCALHNSFVLWGEGV